ncbi:competence/damage-inducible protein A [Phaeovibrio sulfidiphilus]|uniref:competence/damage-inducible protein A n=1 Tax=Phaeovibrio sulfidiphilus TaxID=1220600 RepID=UPI0030845DB7
MKGTIHAALVIIGDEILSGRTQDRNAAYIAGKLNARGIALREIRVVPDVEEAIIEAVGALRARNRYVFTTGGIGPTHDDITTATIAKMFGRAVVRNAEAEAALARHMIGRATLNAARLRMADIPEGAELLENPVSGAPGFRLENVYVLPGVPRIMQVMFDCLVEGLEQGLPILSVTAGGYVREGEIADVLAEIQDRYPETAIGSYPFLEDGRPGTRVVLRGTNARALRDGLSETVALFRTHGEEPDVSGDAV